MKANSTLKLFTYRAIAFFFDLLIITLISFILYFLGLPFFERLSVNLGTYKFIWMSSRIGPVVGWLYAAGFEASKFQGTPAKFILNLKVSDINSGRANFAQTTVRHFAKIISLIPVGFGFFMIFFNKRQQCLHDKIAAAKVSFTN